MTEVSQLPQAASVAPGDSIPVQSAATGVLQQAQPPQLFAAAGVLVAANDLSDVASVSTAVANLGLGSAGATPSSATSVQIPNNISTFFVRGSGTLLSLTLVLPTTPTTTPLTIIFQCGVGALTLQPAAGFSVNIPIVSAPFSAGDRISTTPDGTLWC